MNGTLETVGGRPALRFERRLAHPVNRVWRAIVEPAELERWFVAPVDWTPALGEEFGSPGTPGSGRITELDPPRLIAWAWEGQLFSFELLPDGDGCRLIFTHVFDDGSLAAQQAAGWEIYLGRLDAHLDGRFVGENEAHAGFDALHERYRERFGSG